MVKGYDKANHCKEKTAKPGRFQTASAASAASFCSILQPNYFAGQGHTDTAAAIHEALEKSLLVVVHTICSVQCRQTRCGVKKCRAKRVKRLEKVFNILFNC